ncbi:MAG: helix-turn-helix transcriptional regulator [Lachnospiraceae bacterium]|jgi:plasmid maintenance system antidote protein VapI|nr:helix-turn-helix transcriptional regulator [Lachnospiraceae bacterium]
MIDMNAVIANNISLSLEKQNRKQVELAEYLEISRQTVNKMLSGIRTISAGELRRIADFLCTSMEDLTTIPQNYEETDVFRAFMGKAGTEEARQAVRDIDKIIELILFHDKVRENGIAMREEWTDF